MSFTIQRILAVAPVMVLGLLLLTPAPGLAQAKPDLVVSSLTPPPTTARPGDGFAVTASVRNQGAVAAGASITRFVLVSTPGGAVRKTLSGTQAIPALAAAASSAPAVTLKIFSDTLPGKYVLEACANRGDVAVPESNPTNNCFQTTAQITVSGLPDLVMAAITEPPASVQLGQPFNATYTIQNTGVESAQPSLTKFLLVPIVGTVTTDLKTDDRAVGALVAGTTFTHTLSLIVRAETVPGTYRFRVCADASTDATHPEKMPEKDESNNCKTSVGTVQVTAAPDLVVNKVTVGGVPLTVAQGESLAIGLNVRNLGLVGAPASTLKFRLVSTGVTPLQKGLKGLAAVPPVPAGAKATINATPTVDEETPPGTYVVQACADYLKGVNESAESNNCGLAPETVTVTGLPLSPADLAVMSLTPPPATRLPGESFPVTAAVKNHGTAASPSTTSTFNLVTAAGVRVHNLKGVQIVDPLAAGATNTTQVNVIVYPETPPGTHFLQACADGPKELPEANEGDNCLTSPSAITVLRAPDLVITQVANPPATALPGTGFPITETVKNIGPVDALASTVKFSLVSTADATIQFDLKGTQDVPPLGSTAIFNGSGAVTVRPETLPGSYRVQACADYQRAVLENNEDDNCALSTGTVQVGAVPDLIVFAVTLPPPPVTVAPGAPVALSAVVKNQGLGDAGASSLKFSLVLSPGAAPIRKMTEVVPVAAVVHGGQRTVTATVTIRLSTPPGTYLVQACVDTESVVGESSDENNCGTSVATIKVQ